MVGGAVLCYDRTPIVAGSWTKQTLYLWLTDFWHGQAPGAKPRLMLIDDDSGQGVFLLKRICDSVAIKATFAVIPSKMDTAVCDSLRKWQQEGWGIALHGLRHERWENWSAEMVTADIDSCTALLAGKGFDTGKIEYVVPPHACNTHAIRKAIRQKGYKMVTGANIVNPDTAVFQNGRIFITGNTDLEELRNTLLRAYRKRMFVILGTHSSDTGEFSAGKTKAALQIAKEELKKYL